MRIKLIIKMAMFVSMVTVIIAAIFDAPIVDAFVSAVLSLLVFYILQA